MGDIFNDLRAHRRRLRADYGIECLKCKEFRPKANPTILLPAQKCKVDGYRDPRPRLPNNIYDPPEWERKR